MTRDDVIKMANKAGFHLEMWQLSVGWNVTGTHDELTLFAELVAAHEREECAKVCEEHLDWPSLGPKDCAHAIRARGTQ